MKKNKFLLISICLNILFVLLCVVVVFKKGGIPWILSKVTPATAIVKVEKPPYYFDRTSQFNILPEKKNAIVFLGDSLTDGCEWSELFSNNNIINRGINKDTTQGMTERLNTVIKGQPKKIFIMAGTNDLDQSVKTETTENNYKKIIEEIQNKSPNTRIYIQSVLPMNNKINGSKIHPDSIINLNHYLEKLSSKYNNCKFINLYSHFQVNNQMNTKYTNDGTHLNGQGYLFWKEQIKDFVN